MTSIFTFLNLQRINIELLSKQEESKRYKKGKVHFSSNFDKKTKIMQFGLKALFYLRRKKPVIRGLMSQEGTDKIHHNFET